MVFVRVCHQSHKWWFTTSFTYQLFYTLHFMKRLIFICWLCGWGSLLAQSIDSLVRLTQAPLEAKSSYWWSELGYAYEQNNQTDSALIAYQKCVACAAKQSQPQWQGRCLRYQAMLYLQAYQYTLAEERTVEALGYFEVDSLWEDWAKAQSTLGEIDYSKGSYKSAIEHFILAAAQFERKKDSLRAGVIFGNIGTLFLESKQAANSLIYHRKNLLWIPKTDSARIIQASYNIGASLEAVDSLGLAERWYEKCLSLCRLFPMPRISSYALLGKASLAAKKQEYMLATRLMEQSIALAPDSFSYVNCLVRLGYYQGLAGQKNAAYQKLEQAQYISRRLGQQASLLEAFDYGQEVAAYYGDFDRAYGLQKAHRLLADSLGMQALKSEIKSLEIQYQAAKKSEENLRLQVENTARALDLSRAQTQLRYRSIGLVLLLSLGLIGFMWYRKHNQQKVQRMAQAQRLLAAEAILEGQEKERVRLARELHDGIGGMLASAKSLLSSQTAENQQRGQVALEAVGQELRRVSHDLMPGALARFGLKAALEDLFSQMSQTPKVQLQWYGRARIATDMQSNVFRIVQELYSNALKHAEASNVLVQIMIDETALHLTVEDDGKGFAIAQTQASGIGLDNVRARVAYLDGNVDIQAKTGEGTTIYVQLPLKSDD